MINCHTFVITALGMIACGTKPDGSYRGYVGPIDFVIALLVQLPRVSILYRCDLADPYLAGFLYDYDESTGQMSLPDDMQKLPIYENALRELSIVCPHLPLKLGEKPFTMFVYDASKDELSTNISDYVMILPKLPPPSA